MNPIMLANAGLAAAAFVVLALPVLIAAPRKAGWLPVIAAVALIDSFTTLAPFIYKPLKLFGHEWNWSGKLFDIVALLIVAMILAVSGRISRGEMGFTLRQAPGSFRPALIVSILLLILWAALQATLFGNPKPPSAETLYYEASMPGLAEELSYRGVMLAIFNRMFEGRINLLGAKVGYGALAVSVAFGVLHGIGFGKDFQFQFAPMVIAVTGAIGFVLAWIRERTGSLALPIVVHNATNLIGETVLKIV